MQFRGLDGNHRSSARGGAARSTHRSAAGAALTLGTLLTLVALTGTGCGDDDTINPSVGGSGGTAGNGGGGSGGGGSGGGAGTGGSAGTGGNAGTAGNAGSGGSGGTEGDAGITREQILAAYCARLGEVTGSADDADGGVDTDAGDGGSSLSCAAPENCVEAQEAFYTGFLEATPGFDACIDEADAYYLCQSQAPDSDFECSEGTAQYILGSPSCQEEEDTFQAGLEDPESCAD